MTEELKSITADQANDAATLTTVAPSLAPSTPSKASPDIPTSGSTTPKRRLRGAIASLPNEIRNVVNQSLRDGVRYKSVAAQLDSLGYPGISKRQVGTWARSGYLHWLGQQERFDSALGQTELIAALIGKTNPDAKFDVADLNDMLAATRMHQILQQMDPATFKSLSPEQLGLFLRVAQIICHQTRARSRRQELELKRNNLRLELRKLQIAKEPKGLTPEALAQIEEAMAQF